MAKDEADRKSKTAPDPLLTVAEVAHRLSCSEAMVRKLTKLGSLTHVRVGDLVRFRPGDVEAYVTGQLVAVRPEIVVRPVLRAKREWI
jgi:excisionase family DNA binding protein